MIPTNGRTAGTSEIPPSAPGDAGPRVPPLAPSLSGPSASSALAKLLVLIRTEPPPGLSHEITVLRTALAEAVETFVRECSATEASERVVYLAPRRETFSEAEKEELEAIAAKYPRFVLVFRDPETSLITLQEAVRDALRTEAVGVRRDALEAVQKGNVEMAEAWIGSLGNYAPYKHSVTSPVSEGVRGILEGAAASGETWKEPKDFDHVVTVATLGKRIAVAKTAPYRVSGLIPQNGLVIVVGDSGIGKSAFLYQLGVCVATGKPFLGHPVEKGRVLLFDGENAPVQSYNLIQQLQQHLAIEEVSRDFLLYNRNDPHPKFGQTGEIVPNLVEGGRAAVLKPGSLRESSKPFTTKENRREETISHSGFREATASQPQRPHPPAQPKLPTHAALG